MSQHEKPQGLISFEEKIKEGLREKIADLIPQDRIDTIVASAVVEFERKHLRELVIAELTEHFKGVIASAFKGDEWQIRYGNNGQALASEAVSKLIVELAPQILANMIGGYVNSAVQSMQGQFAYRGY